MVPSRVVQGFGTRVSAGTSGAAPGNWRGEVRARLARPTSRAETVNNIVERNRSEFVCNWQPRPRRSYLSRSPGVFPIFIAPPLVRISSSLRFFALSHSRGETGKSAKEQRK